MTSLHKRVIESHLLYQQNPCLLGAPSPCAARSPAFPCSPGLLTLSMSPSCSRFLLFPSPPRLLPGGLGAALAAGERQREPGCGYSHGWRWVRAGGKPQGWRKRRSGAFPPVTWRLLENSSYESFPLGDGNSPHRLPALPLAAAVSSACTGLLAGCVGGLKAKKDKMSPCAGAGHAPEWGLCPFCTLVSAVGLLPHPS